MAQILSNIWFFLILIPGSFLIYQLLKVFDYSKILLKGQTAKFKILLVIIAIIIAFLFASCFVSVIDRINSFIVK